MSKIEIIKNYRDIFYIRKTESFLFSKTYYYFRKSDYRNNPGEWFRAQKNGSWFKNESDAEDALAKHLEAVECEKKENQYNVVKVLK